MFLMFMWIVCGFIGVILSLILAYLNFEEIYLNDIIFVASLIILGPIIFFGSLKRFFDKFFGNMLIFKRKK